MPIDTSMYQNAYTPPPNPLDTVGGYVGVANELMRNRLLQTELPIQQQQLQQQQVATQQAQAKIRAGQLWQQMSQESPTGVANPYKYLQAVSRDPSASLAIDDAYRLTQPLFAAHVSGYTTDAHGNRVPYSLPEYEYQARAGGGEQSPSAPSSGDNAQSQPDQQSAPTVSPQGGNDNNPANLPGAVMGLPEGYTSPLAKSRENYNQVIEDAKSAPGQNAAYNEVINLANHGVISGTTLTHAYQVAARNDPFHLLTGATDQTVMNQELAKWMSQGLLANGMPGSDARLAELQHGNLNPEQLTETLKNMAPFFKAVSEGALRKQDYYNSHTNNGTDLANEPIAKQHWDDNYDPRWIEFSDLAPKEKKQFLKEHPDMLNSRNKYETLKKMGVVQ